MPTTSDFKATPGSGSNIATYSITEDSETKQLGRAVLSTSAGVESGTAASPTRIDPTGTTTQPVQSVAGTAIIGKVTTDQTTHGTTDLVAADITKVAGSAISQGHGTAATAIRVELPTDGTGNVGLNAGSNNIGTVNVNSADSTQAFSFTATGNSTALAISGYYGVGIQVGGFGSGTLLPQISYDGGTTWIASQFYNATTQAITSSVTANGEYAILITGGVSHVRINCSVYASGTIAGAIRATISQTLVDTIQGTVAATQSATWTVQPGNTANTTPWLEQPMLLGRTTLPSSVSSGTAIQQLGDRYGREYVVDPVCSNVSSAGTAITTNTNTSIITAPSAGNHLRIHYLFAQNSSSTGTWCYWGNGSGVKTRPFYLAQNQSYAAQLKGKWELSSATALFMNTATTGANIEWYVEYETLAD